MIQNKSVCPCSVGFAVGSFPRDVLTRPTDGLRQTGSASQNICIKNFLKSTKMQVISEVSTKLNKIVLKRSKNDQKKVPKNVQKKVRKRDTKFVKNGSQQEFKKGPTRPVSRSQLVKGLQRAKIMIFRH